MDKTLLNNRVLMVWSGGCDSTLALLHLLKEINEELSKPNRSYRNEGYFYNGLYSMILNINGIHPMCQTLIDKYQLK